MRDSIVNNLPSVVSYNWMYNRLAYKVIEQVMHLFCSWEGSKQCWLILLVGKHTWKQNESGQQKSN